MSEDQPPRPTDLAWAVLGFALAIYAGKTLYGRLFGEDYDTSISMNAIGFVFGVGIGIRYMLRGIAALRAKKPSSSETAETHSKIHRSD